MGDFNNYKLFKNVGIRSSDNKLIVMNVNKSNKLLTRKKKGQKLKINFQKNRFWIVNRCKYPF